MRLFAGIPLAAPVVDELSAISLRLRAPGDGLRWSTPESWHVTLQFLGSVNQEQYECIVARLCRLRLPPVPIRLDAMGFFDRAGIFFAGVSPTPELLSLQQAVTAATGVCGFVPETRPYHPHITLARTKGKAGGHALTALKSRTQSRPTANQASPALPLKYSFSTKASSDLLDPSTRFASAFASVKSRTAIK